MGFLSSHLRVGFGGPVPASRGWRLGLGAGPPAEHRAARSAKKYSALVSGARGEDVAPGGTRRGSVLRSPVCTPVCPLPRLTAPHLTPPPAGLAGSPEDGR